MSTSLVGFRILVVDDEAVLGQLTAESLAPNGATVFTATGVVEAVRILAREQIDAVLSDLRMPNGDGMSLLQHMKSVQHAALFYLLTAYSDIKTRDLQDAGGRQVFQKPADLQIVALTIAADLRESRNNVATS